METLLSEIIKSSPVLGVMVLFWYYQRKDYQTFVDKVQEQNATRESNYQNTIDKLTEKLSIVENVEEDVKEIKDYIFKK